MSNDYGRLYSVLQYQAEVGVMPTETRTIIAGVQRSWEVFLLRLPVFAVIWIGFLLIKIPTTIAGAVAVPLMWRYRETPYDKLPSWTRPWANPEDWHGGPQHFRNCMPKWWVQQKGEGFISFWRYHAWRNTANGLRSFELLDLDIDMSRVHFVHSRYFRYYEPWHIRVYSPKTKFACYAAWQGLQCGVKVLWMWSSKRHFVFKLGWRVEPRDAREKIDPSGIRWADAGFATKLVPWRKG